MWVEGVWFWLLSGPIPSKLQGTGQSEDVGFHPLYSRAWRAAGWADSEVIKGEEPAADDEEERLIDSVTVQITVCDFSLPELTG